jgi:hypothetical protein
MNADASFKRNLKNREKIADELQRLLAIPGITELDLKKFFRILHVCRSDTMALESRCALQLYVCTATTVTGLSDGLRLPDEKLGNVVVCPHRV